MHLPPLLYVVLCSSLSLKCMFTIGFTTFYNIQHYLSFQVSFLSIILANNSSPLLLSPTCPSKSASIVNLSPQGHSLQLHLTFSEIPLSVLFPTCEAYTSTTFNINSLIPSSKFAILSDSLHVHNTIHKLFLENDPYSISFRIYTIVEKIESTLGARSLTFLPPGLLHTQYIYLPISASSCSSQS